MWVQIWEMLVLACIFKAYWIQRSFFFLSWVDWFVEPMSW